MKDEFPKLKDIFPFEYQGGGYFRDKDVAIGISAEILHGQQAIEYVYAKLKERIECTELMDRKTKNENFT